MERLAVKNEEHTDRLPMVTCRRSRRRPVRAHAWSVCALAALGLAPTASAVAAQSAAQDVRVEQLRASPQAHVNQIRRVSGVVDRLVSRPGAAAPSFYLEDDYGHQVMVVPFAEAPARGERLTVTGVVTLDPAGDPVLTMFDESAGGGPESEPDSTGSAPAPPAGDSAQQTRFAPELVGWLLGAAAFVGLVLVGSYLVQRGPFGERTKPLVTGPLGHQDVDLATSALWPQSEREFDGRTVRFTRPDPTAQLMAARLEVMSGPDVGEEIRFLALPGEDVSMMFGRSPGTGPTHVQLKQKTVSRTHAVVRYRHGEWMLENLSMTNPTILNEEVLGVKERLLSDGDHIEMGEVSFRFRTS
jgi:hypothetical protein